jgi:hypothetical protein
MFTGVVEQLTGTDDGVVDDRLRTLEIHRRRVIAEQAAAIAVAESSRLFLRDGHLSMNAYLRATLNCSTGEATRWRRLAKLVATVPGVGDALIEGRVGEAQAHELARVRANPRCGDRLVEVAPLLVGQAETLEFADFKTCVRRWELLADEDGAHRDRERSVEARNASVLPVGAGIDLRASGGDPITAAEMIAIFDAFIQAEFDADQAARLAEFGDHAAGQPFARTSAQRRFDALAEIFRRAAASPAGSGRRVNITVNVIVDERTLTETLVAHHLTPTTALDPAAGGVADPGPGGRRCETAAGTPIHPDDVLAATIHGHVRRVILDGAGVVIDMGRRRRLFTGAAREAAQLSARRCTRPGCTVPSTLAQIDHLRDHAHGGATNPHNGGPACTSHNNDKNRGFTVMRDHDGRVIHFRPDGRAITAAGQAEPIPGHPDWRCRRLRYDQLHPLDLTDPDQLPFDPP